MIDPVPPRRSMPYSFLDNISEFVRSEMDAEVESKANSFRDQPFWLLRNNVDVPFVSGATLVRFINSLSFQIPGEDIDIRRDYGFFNDHIVGIINRNSNTFYRGTISNITKTSLGIDIPGSSQVPLDTRRDLRDANAEDIGIVGLAHPKRFDREVRGLQRLRTNHRKHQIILGKRELTFSSNRPSQTQRFDSDIYDNSAQSAGVEMALSADDLVCIQGPPGTGKTRVIIELVHRFVEAGDRVLVAAETNTAVDNILIGEKDKENRDHGSLHVNNSYVHSFGRFPVARNNPIRSDSTVVHEHYHDLPVESARVVLSTNNSAAKLESEFEVAIIDEAAQAMLSSSVIPYSISDQIVLVGDHKQMPPERESPKESEDDRRHISLFQHIYDANKGLFGTDSGVQFRKQYRMHPTIASIPNDFFYDGTLENAVNHQPVLSHPLVMFDIIGSQEQWYSNSPYNESEAILALKQIQYLLNHGVEATDIGVITPYTGQARRIGELIRQTDDDFSKVTVNTIAAFQGSEKIATIISFVRANPDGDVGFLNREDGPNRLNVALTRGKKYTGLIGNWETLREHDLYDEIYSRITTEIGCKRIQAKQLQR